MAKTHSKMSVFLFFTHVKIPTHMKFFSEMFSGKAEVEPITIASAEDLMRLGEQRDEVGAIVAAFIDNRHRLETGVSFGGRMLLEDEQREEQNTAKALQALGALGVTIDSAVLEELPRRSL